MRVFCVQVSFKTKYATVDKGNRLRNKKKKKQQLCFIKHNQYTTELPDEEKQRWERGGGEQRKE